MIYIYKLYNKNSPCDSPCGAKEISYIIKIVRVIVRVELKKYCMDQILVLLLTNLLTSPFIDELQDNVSIYIKKVK